jgi:hypothetical protein
MRGTVGRTTMHDDIPRVWIPTVPGCESMQTDSRSPHGEWSMPALGLTACPADRSFCVKRRGRSFRFGDAWLHCQGG